MRVAVVNPPFAAPPGSPTRLITVPPASYGGIQWFVAHLSKGLAELGHDVVVLGAPESPPRPGIEAAPAGEPEEIRAWVRDHEVDVVHDISNDAAALREEPGPLPYLSTHHFTGRPRFARNPVFVSRAQRAAAGGGDAPVVRIPVDPDVHELSEEKDDFALFLGRVAPWKGAWEAADFCARAGLPLVVAGPTWETDYAERIERDFGDVVTFAGDVGGAERRSLLARARAVLVFSRSVPGPWGDVWCEPGATVVGEAAVSGTPVVSSDNGCLPEIVPLVGTVLPEGAEPAQAEARDVVDSLPSPAAVREAALAAWHYRTIAARYVEVYERVAAGSSW